MADDGLQDIGAQPPTEFNRNLRCCVTCRLVKTLDQFYEQGCENCPFLEMVENRERIDDATTTEFQVKGITSAASLSRQYSSKQLFSEACSPPLTAADLFLFFSGHVGCDRPLNQLGGKMEPS